MRNIINIEQIKVAPLLNLEIYEGKMDITITNLSYLLIEYLNNSSAFFLSRLDIYNSIFTISLRELSLMPEFFLAFTAIIIITHCSIVAYNKKYKNALLQFSVTSLSILIVLLTLILYFHEGSVGINYFSLEFAFMADSLGYFSKIFTMAASLLCMYFLQDYIIEYKVNNTEYNLLMLYAILGLTLLISANDFATIFLALELQSLSLYMLSGFKKNSIYSIESGLKYFIVGALSAAYFLLGFNNLIKLALFCVCFIFCFVSFLGVRVFYSVFSEININMENLVITLQVFFHMEEELENLVIEFKKCYIWEPKPRLKLSRRAVCRILKTRIGDLGPSVGLKIDDFKTRIVNDILFGSDVQFKNSNMVYYFPTWEEIDQMGYLHHNHYGLVAYNAFRLATTVIDEGSILGYVVYHYPINNLNNVRDYSSVEFKDKCDVALIINAILIRENSLTLSTIIKLILWVFTRTTKFQTFLVFSAKSLIEVSEMLYKHSESIPLNGEDCRGLTGDYYKAVYGVLLCLAVIIVDDNDRVSIEYLNSKLPDSEEELTEMLYKCFSRIIFHTKKA